MQSNDTRTKMISEPARPGRQVVDRPRRPTSRPARRAAFLVTVAMAVGTVRGRPGRLGHRRAETAGGQVPAAAVPAVTAPAHPKTPPANPTNTQINAAAAAKRQAASDVGRLSGLIVGVNARIGHLSDVAELAGEKYLQARWKLGLAQTSATKAQKAVVARAEELRHGPLPVPALHRRGLYGSLG